MTGNRDAGLAGKVAVVALALGALSLSYGAAQWWHHRRLQALSQAEENEEERKKRPYTDSHSPDQHKRLRTAVDTDASDLDGIEPSKPAGLTANSVRKQGSVPDQTALLAAKITVPDTDQGDPQKLGRHYDTMTAKFANSGLNLRAISDARKFYSVSNGRAEPLDYSEFETPLSRGAVRLGVFRLTNERPHNLANEAKAATKSILESLPKGSIVHRNLREHYHTTIQMISHPSDPRPNPFVAGGGLDRARLPHPIPAPSQETLRKEQGLYRAIAAAGFAPVLLIHSVVFADSGSLLLLFTDSTGLVHALRKRLKQTFPGAADKQPSILHVTLARLLSPDQMKREEIDRVTQACKRWTEHLRGKRFSPDALWHVQENKFTYVNVDKTCLRCPFMPPIEIDSARIRRQ